METANSSWTAVFDNSAQGADPTAALSHYFAKTIGIKAVSVKEIPHTLDKKSYTQHRGRYGARELIVWGPGEAVRGIGLVNEDKWVFWTGGEPLEFEDVASYTAHRKTDRFTHDMLVAYCRKLGLNPFEEDFYVPNGKGLLMETHVDQPRVQMSLAQARAGYEDRDVTWTA
ncbi:hypothetical protein ACIPY0_14845 [Paenarthrobacter nicotinovorans]|uniref:hypothetical protein n=1 Tax=Paenarthrobacter nicotinovorans TaxID=29320 RepID=UPI0037FBCD5C